MAKTQDKLRASGKEVKKRNNPSTFSSHIGKACQTCEGLKQLQRPIEATNIASTYQESDPDGHEEVIHEHKAGSNWSEILYHDSSADEEEVETGKTSKAVPYQLQQWMFESSNPSITLAERLEKSKWKYEDIAIEEDLLVDESCENWGRKPYDWILFTD